MLWAQATVTRSLTNVKARVTVISALAIVEAPGDVPQSRRARSPADAHHYVPSHIPERVGMGGTL